MRRLDPDPPRWNLPEYTWGEERELCRRCEHYRERITGNRHTGHSVVMRCAIHHKSGRGIDHGSCIDMRYDGPCGREGKLFKEKAK